MQQLKVSRGESDSPELTTMRTCIHCFRTMSEELFYFHKGRGKFGNQCLECRRERGRKYCKQYNREAAEAQYVRRLPNQLAASLRKTVSLLKASERYGCPLEREAQRLLKEIYGETAPGQWAELQFQMHEREARK